MDLDKTLEIINKDRSKAEACFVFSLWKDPDLYADYLTLNTGADQTLKDKDAIFYYKLGRELYKNGFRTFDGITLDTFLSTRPKIEKKFNEYGGMNEVEQLKSLVSIDNVEAYFDAIAKRNSLSLLAEKYTEIFEDVGRFDDATNEDVYNAFDLLNSSVSLATGNDVKIEDLTLDDQYLQDCENGLAKGLDYGASCPILNYITLGIPKGDLTLLAGFSGTGKSSWAFENLILSLNKQGIKTAIISNEMRSEAYKNMLTAHILTKDMDYWGLTRKKLKMGGFTDEQKEKLKEAQKISHEKYNNIRFIKLFDNEIGRVIKFIRKLATQGYDMVFFDTFKGDDESEDNVWLKLITNSRKLFQIASKYNIAIVCTYQLALYAENQRYLGASCLSSSKQIKEVVSELIMMRYLWQDEYSGEKHDCKPYTLKKDKNGKYIRDESIQLDPTKKYIVFFLNKSRSDEDQQQVLMEFNGRYNSWREIGRCTILNDHKGN